MTVAFAAIPRILYSIAQEGLFFGPLSKPFGTLNKRFATPVLAIVTFAALAAAAALFSADVIDWILAGAYVWLLIYITYHLLLIANRITSPKGTRHLLGAGGYGVAIAGLILSAVGLYDAFLGAHRTYLPKAGLVLGIALVASALAVIAPNTAPGRPGEATGRSRDDERVPSSRRAEPFGGAVEPQPAP